MDRCKLQSKITEGLPPENNSKLNAKEPPHEEGTVHTETKPLRVGFIGAGKAGTSLGKYIAVRISEQDQAPISLTGYFSLNPDSAGSAAKLTGSAAFSSDVLLAEDSDVIFFSVPDGEIKAAFGELTRNSRDAGADLSGKMFAHLSGSLSSRIFAPANTHAEDGAGISGFSGTNAPSRPSDVIATADSIDHSIFSLHPACALPDRNESWKLLRNTCFVFEGSNEAYARIAPLLELLGNPIGAIKPERKALYHAACVFLSNFTVGLAAEGTRLLASCGLDAEISSKFLETLFLGNAENVATKGPTAALTGPAERGDAGTIREHMDALSGLGEQSLTDVYRSMTKILLRVASEKHPDRDYANALAAIEAGS